MMFLDTILREKCILVILYSIKFYKIILLFLSYNLYFLLYEILSLITFLIYKNVNKDIKPKDKGEKIENPNQNK